MYLSRLHISKFRVFDDITLYFKNGLNILIGENNSGKTAIIDCTPFERREMGKVVRSMAVGHGITFTEGAASALLDLVGTNTVSLDAEIRKLSLSHRGSDPVNENEVLSMVSFTKEIKPWEFVDAFAARNPHTPRPRLPSVCRREFPCRTVPLRRHRRIRCRPAP